MQTMTKKFSSLFIALLAVLTFSSCLNSDDDETTYYDDTAITAFSLGTLNVKHTVKAHDGVTDSTYYTTLTGSNYKFSIDQLTRTIYNTDSLPVDSRVSKVLATITTKNSGMVVLNLHRQDGSDSLAYYSSTDSIDFSSPVRLRVYNMLATAYREYTVTVNVHKQLSNQFNWNTTTGPLENIGNRKIVFLGNNAYLYGVTLDGQTVGFQRNGDNWSQISTTLDRDAYKNMTAFNGYLYTLSGSNIYRSANGSDWSLVAEAQGIKQIVGASKTKLYALTENGVAYSTDGKTWTADRLDDEVSKLPAEDVNFICQTSKLDENVSHLILIGNLNGKTTIWSKVEENDNAQSTEPWAYYSDDDYNRKTLPYLSNLQVVSYNGGLLATGGDLSKFYTSPDMGLTWSTVSTYNLPEAMTGTAVQSTLAADSTNILYFSPMSSNTVLTGRLAILGWKDNQTVFTK